MARSESAILKEVAPKKRKVLPSWELVDEDGNALNDDPVKAKTAEEAALVFVRMEKRDVRKVENEGRDPG